MVNRFLRGLYCVLLVVVVALGAASGPRRSAVAQGGSQIGFEQTATGLITNDEFRVLYTFVGRQGDVVDITLSRTDGTLDPMLILLDDHNNLIARDDDSGNGYDAALISQPLPTEGTYFIVVTRFGQERGMTTGGYKLTLSRVGLTSGTTTELQYGDNIVGELNNSQFQQVYIFQATRGDLINIAMQRISGDLDSFLILADAESHVMMINDEDPNSPGTLDAAINTLRITRTGSYILVATRFGRAAGPSQGGFSLTLNRLPPESLGNVPEKAIWLDYGNSASGSISADSLATFYTLETRKGDVLTIDVERTHGNLDPIVTLSTTDLKVLASNDSGQRGQSAIISAYTVPASGSYILTVSRYNQDKGVTAGDYSLSLIGRKTVAVGSDGRATLQYNTAVNAIIDDRNVAQVYTFSGTARDVLTIDMKATSGNLLPAFTLVDQNNKQIAQDDIGDTSATLTRFKLPQTGTYRIIATRHGREKGATSGAYRLTLTQISPAK